MGERKQQRLVEVEAKSGSPHIRWRPPSLPLGPEGEGKSRREGALARGPWGTWALPPSLHAHTRLRGLLVSYMDDGRAEATLTGDGHHALRLIGQGERAQGASHHRLLPRGGPLPRQHCRRICAERWHQLPPPPQPGGQERKPQEERGRTDSREESEDLEAEKGTRQSKVGVPKTEQ